MEKKLILISRSLAKCNGLFCSGDFAVWEAPASLQRCIEVILRIELKQSYCEILESVPAVLAKLSWNFHPSLSCCRALAKNRQCIAGLSIYYRDMTCFDGLYLKKSRSDGLERWSIPFPKVDSAFQWSLQYSHGIPSAQQFLLVHNIFHSLKINLIKMGQHWNKSSSGMLCQTFHGTGHQAGW